VLNPTGTAAFTGSRDTSILNMVLVDSAGASGPADAPHCAPDTGNDATHDCRKGLINLLDAGVDGPYSIVSGNILVPGETSPRGALFVSSIIPHIVSVTSGTISASSSVAVLDLTKPSTIFFTIRASIPFIWETAPGPMVFDAARRQLYLSGCYQRSTALGAGEPGTGLCIGVTNNYLRILNVDSENAAADPVLIDLRTDILSTYTVQLLLADFDPVTGAPGTLWAITRTPDALLRIELPQQPSVPPRLRQAIPMPVSPADMVRISRTGASDLLAVVTEKNNGVDIVDTATGGVVAVAGRLGDSPFMIQEISCPPDASFADSACLAATVFGECRVAFIEVPKSQPTLTKVRALAGSCPP
jgi:hypothetical protein